MIFKGDKDFGEGYTYLIGPAPPPHPNTRTVSDASFDGISSGGGKRERKGSSGPKSRRERADSSGNKSSGGGGGGCLDEVCIAGCIWILKPTENTKNIVLAIRNTTSNRVQIRVFKASETPEVTPIQAPPHLFNH